MSDRVSYVMRWRDGFWCAYRLDRWECNYYGSCFEDVVYECRYWGGTVFAVERRSCLPPIT